MTRTERAEQRQRQKITVLSVGPVDQDHAALSDILATAHWPLCPGSEWTLETSPDLPAALAALKRANASLVICERDLGPSSWRDLWEQAGRLQDPPFLIVTSRLADEYLWAEALNLVAYDVLAKPFDRMEVVRTLSQAWLHRCSRPARPRNLAAVGHPLATSDSRVAV